MNANARKVHGIVVGFGVACAVAAALPCIAGEATPAVDTVTVQAQSVPPDSSSPADQGKKKGKSAPMEENVGFFSGLAIGAVAGGPVGAMVGGITGALIGEHIHKQKVANQQLTTDLSGSNADKAKLTETVTQLDGTLQLTQQQQAALSASLEHARELTLNIAFRTGDANLTVDDIDQLTALGQLVNGMAGVKIQVSGHADPRGPADYNLTLSKDRAESVAAVLTNAGLGQERVVIEALGANGNDATGNPDDYAFQRRVTLKLVGTAPVDDDSKVAATVAQVQ